MLSTLETASFFPSASALTLTTPRPCPLYVVAGFSRFTSEPVKDQSFTVSSPNPAIKVGVGVDVMSRE